MSKVMVWFGAIFGGVGLVFAAIGGWFFLDDRDLAAGGVRTQGTVIELVESRDSDGDYSYRPRVEFFAPDGTRHEFTGRVGSSPPSHSAGETVEVIYAPDRPDRAMIDGFFDRFLVPLVFGGMGSLFAAIGGGVLFALIRRRRIVEQLRTNGLPIQARFVDCYQDTSVKVNGRSPWRVTCQAPHPATGKLQSFRSDAIWVDPSASLAGRDVRVLVDPAKPKRYFVDLAPYLDESALA